MYIYLDVFKQMADIVVYWPPTRPNMLFQRRRKCIFRWRDLWIAWQLFPLDDDQKHAIPGVGVELLYNSVHRKFNQFGHQTR